MFSEKIALSLTEEKNLSENPLNSPVQFMRVPNNTPQQSPMESTKGSMETLTNQSRFSQSINPTFKLTDFQNQVLQTLSNKLTLTNVTKSNFIDIPNTLPVITLSPAEPTTLSYDTNYIEDSLNMIHRNTSPLSKSCSDISLAHSSPLSDKVSNRATYASGCSYPDSLSDFDIFFTSEELPIRDMSLSLGDLQDFCKMSDFNNEKDIKLCKKSLSYSDLQENVFDFDV